MKLTELERAFVHAVCSGEWFIPYPGGLDAFNELDEEAQNTFLSVPEEKTQSLGDERSIRAEVLEKLLKGVLFLDGNDHPVACHENGIRIAGARLDGSAVIKALDIDRPLIFTACEFNGPVVINDCQFTSFESHFCRFNEFLSLSQSHILGILHLHDCQFLDELDLLSARIENFVSLRRCSFARAAVFEFGRFERDVEFSDIECAAVLSLFGAYIGQRLDIDGVKGLLAEPENDKDREIIQGVAIQLAYTRIQSKTSIRNAELAGVLSLYGAHTAAVGIYGPEIKADGLVTVDCTDAKIIGDLNIGPEWRDNEVCTPRLNGSLAFNRAQIAGSLTLSGVQIECQEGVDTSVSLYHAIVGGNLSITSYVIQPEGDNEATIIPGYYEGAIRASGITVGRSVEFVGCYVESGSGVLNHALDFSLSTLGSFRALIFPYLLSRARNTQQDHVLPSVDGVFRGDSLVNCFIGGVSLDSATVKDLVMMASTQVTGAISFGSLNAGTVTFTGYDLDTRDNHKTDSWRDCPGQVDGLLSLNSSKIKRDLSISSTIFRCLDSSPHKTDEQTYYKGTSIDLDTLDIDGRFFLTNFPKPAQGDVRLEGVTTRYFIDDKTYLPEQGSPYKLVLDGFEYLNFADHGEKVGEWSVKDRLRWLKSQRTKDLKGPGFKPQPWEQLYKAYRRAGHQNDARRIAIEKRDLAVASGTYGTVTSSLYWLVAGLTCGYGFAPIRAMFLWLALVIGGAFFFANAHENGRMIPALERTLLYQAENGKLPEKYPDFQPLLYSVDAVLPFFELEQTDYWIPDGTEASNLEDGEISPPVLRGLSIERIYYSIHGILGFLLMAAAAIGFTGVLRREG